MDGVPAERPSDSDSPGVPGSIASKKGRLLWTPELFVAVFALRWPSRLLDRTFDDIFVAAGGTKAGVVHEISKCLTAVPNVRSRCCNLRAQILTGCSMSSVKLTVEHVYSSRITDIENQQF